jgi:hypothetical protein
VKSGAQAKKMEVIYAETLETAEIVVTIGDSIRGEDWARTQYPDDLRMQDSRAGLYACFLAAKRARLAATEGDWLDWLDAVTMPEDEHPGDGPDDSGESAGPRSDA